MSSTSLILTLAIIAGQLIKFPITAHSGVSLLDIVVAAFCIKGLLKLRFRLKNPSLSLTGALLFIFVAILSLILTPLNLQPQELLIGFLYTIRFSAYIILGWLIISDAFPDLRHNIPKILIFSGLGLAIIGLLQIVFLPDLRFLEKWGFDPHIFRNASTFLDPNFSGAFFVLTLILFISKTPPVSFFGYTLFLILYLALLTTFSRSSYLMFLVSFLTFSFLKKSVKIAVLTIILFAFLLLSFQFYILAVNTVTPLDRDQTASFRFTTWQQGFEIFQKNPILGVGFNAYNFALRQYKLGDEQFLNGKGSTTNDSSLLYILSTTGVLGFISYFIFIYGLMKSSQSKNLTLKASIPGLLAHSFFVNSLFYPFILIWIILTVSNSNDNQPVK